MKSLLLSCLLLFYIIVFTLANKCFREDCYVDGILGCKHFIRRNFTAEECCKQGSAVGFSETIIRVGNVPGCYKCDRCYELLPLINGQWSEWSEWSACSKSCDGIGVKTRHRRCDSPAPSDLGKKCNGEGVQRSICNNEPCPIHGQWSGWSSWSHCSKSCGVGKIYRFRDCNNPTPAHGGRSCQGLSTLLQECILVENCPIDGGWSGWSSVSSCSKSCGTGKIYRSRECNNPTPAYGGKACQGLSTLVQECIVIENCSIDGGWGEWSAWTKCSKSCGGGESHQYRSCNNPLPQFGGKTCIGESRKSDSCNNKPCPIDGQWSDWSPYFACIFDDCNDLSKGGHQTRSRSCNRPSPKFGGKMCTGKLFDTAFCIEDDNCARDGEWSEWGPWQCSETGVYRVRECLHRRFEGKYCPGNYIANKPISDPTFCDDCKSHCRVDDSGKLKAHYIYHRQLQNARHISDTGDRGSGTHSVDDSEEDEFSINIVFDTQKCRCLN